MKQFTYYDYLEYEKLKIFFNRRIGAKTEQITILRENSEKYSYIDYTNEKRKNKIINNQHDKIFRMGLDNSKEVAKFINKKIDLKLELKRRKIRKI